MISITGQQDACRTMQSEMLRRVIDFAKLLSRFTALSENDQIAIIKGVTRGCYFIRA